MNEQERLFVEYWERRRTTESDIVYQLMAGLPIGLLFSLPIMILLYTGQWWHKRADMVANSRLSPLILVIAIFLIAVFVAVLYKRHQWDMKEQQYLEIKRRHSQDVNS
jgi:membrane protein YdbS with pleckstrin-like domain